MDTTCHYCVRGEAVAKFGLEIARLSVSTFYLFREQSHPGRSMVALDRHVGDITDLSAEERAAFFGDLARASKALQAAFKPDKINYGAFGDKMCHLHFHLVPKYKDGFEWGDVFAMNPMKTMLTDAEYAQMIAKIKACL